MRKITTLLCFAAAVLAVLTGCSVPQEYKLTLLGDIHYDAAQYHDYSQFGLTLEGRKVAKQAQLNKDGYYSPRSSALWITQYRGDSRWNLPKNEAMWKNFMPQLLQEAAQSAEKNKSLYAIQLGDLIHGDCGHLHLHKANLNDALNVLDKYFTCPVLTVCGNHDPRGIYGQQAWDEVVNPHIDRTTDNAPRRKANYYFAIGPDFYYFHDIMNPDLDFLEKALEQHKNARYKFFLAHAPLIPESRRHSGEILTDDYARIFALLEKAEVIVLAGHTHWPSLVEYKNPDNGRIMSQFILNSTVRYPQKQLNFIPGTEQAEGNIPSHAVHNLPLFDKYYAGKIKTVLSTSGTGHALLRVNNDGVFVDYKNLSQEKIHTFRLR